MAGFNSANFINLRIGKGMTYVPAHTRNGKLNNAKVQFPAIENDPRAGIDPTTGKKRVNVFNMTAWGKYAEVFVRTGTVGKEFSGRARIGQYFGRLFDPATNLPRLDNAGNIIMVRKTGYTVRRFIFGDDSRRQIAEEIEAKFRPVQWEIQTHPDAQLWKETLNRRLHAQWDGKATQFMYARVIVPTGAGVQLDFTKPYEPGQTQSPVAVAAGTPSGMPDAVAAVSDGLTPPITAFDPNAQVAPAGPAAPTNTAPLVAANEGTIPAF